MHARTSSIPLLAALGALLFTTAVRAEAPFKTAIWVQPAVPVAVAAFDAVNGLPLELIYVPVGATFETGGDWALSVELSYHRYTPFCIDSFYCYTAFGWIGSVGALYHPGGGGALHGFFIEPKLIASSVTTLYRDGLSYSPTGMHIPRPPNHASRGVELGVDIGYQLNFGNFYVAPVIGVSAGLCTSCLGGITQSMAYSFGGDAQAAGGVAPIYDLNLNLLRVGATF